MKVLLIFTICATAIAHQSHKQVIEIPTDTDNFHISYVLDMESSMITFDCNVHTVGYIGFGFSNTSTMTDADLVMGGIRENGSYFGVSFVKRNYHHEIIQNNRITIL
jgi:hypothetical protein